jgi:hypothetical protein
MGAWVGSPCDTLTVGSQEFGVRSDAELFVTYISEWQKLFVNAQNLKGRNCVLEIFDVAGKNLTPALSKGEGVVRGGYFTKDVNCTGFAKGMYLVNLRTEKEILTMKFIKQ